MQPVTFTLDLEDQRAPGDPVPRYVDATHRLLEFLAERDVRGTVFVVGELAEQSPELVKEIAAGGHEVALHGWSHDALATFTPDEFRRDAARGRALLEDTSGAAVTGFRAPMFSLVPESRWATDVLAELGFGYSSSVLPARNPLFGDPTCPARPFRWPSGLLELPCPVMRVGDVGLPFLGGVYFRSLPLPVVESAGAIAGRDQLLWVYCHPYDFDPDEPFWVVPEVGPYGSRLLWYNRRNMLAKLGRVLAGRTGAPLAERAQQIFPTR